MGSSYTHCISAKGKAVEMLNSCKSQERGNQSVRTKWQHRCARADPTLDSRACCSLCMLQGSFLMICLLPYPGNA